MRVLLTGMISVRSSDATLLLAKALERAGATVDLLPVDADRGVPFVARLGLAIPKFDRTTVTSFNRWLVAEARAHRPDLVLLYGSNWTVPPRTIRILQRELGCQVMLWEVNHFFWGGFRGEALPLYDGVFVLDSYFVPGLRSAGVRRVRHLPACADPEEHFPVALSANDQERYSADVCFIGTPSERRISFLRAITHVNLQLYGPGWDGTGPDLTSRVRLEPIYGLKKSKVYAGSRMSLNVQRDHMVFGENFRVFEVAACGGVPLSTHKPDLVECLTPGEEVLIFDSPEGLRSTVDHYLKNPDELDAISRAARKRVLGEHTYDHRAETILEYAGTA